MTRVIKAEMGFRNHLIHPPHFITRALRVKPAPRQRASSEQTREESPGVQTPVQSSVRCSGNRRRPEGITNHRQQRRTQDSVCGNAPQTLWAAISRGASRQLLKAVSHRKIITQLKKERLHWLLSIHTQKKFQTWPKKQTITLWLK